MSMLLPVPECPPLIRKTADEFKDLLTPSEYRAFTASLCAAAYGISGYSDIFRYVMFAPSVSAIGDFFNAKESLAQKLNRRHRRRLLRILRTVTKDPSRYQWVIDDTIVQHYGKTIWGAYNWHDHVTDGYVFGHKILVLGIEDRKRRLLIPVAWEILHRDLSEEAEDDAENTHEKGWQVALRLLDDMIAFGFPKLTVAADCWFACEELFAELDTREFAYVMEIRSNRKIAQHGRSNSEISVTEFFSDRERHVIQHNGKPKFASEAVLVLNRSERRLKVVAVANKRSLDDKAFGFYVTNQLTWNASRVWGISRDRWGIEVQFRDLKQLFTFGEAAVRSRQAVETSISVSAIALTVIRLEQIAQADANENQHVRPRTAGSIVRDFQLDSLLRCVTKLASTNESIFRSKFQRRMNRRNMNSKPTEAQWPNGRTADQGVYAKTGS